MIGEIALSQNGKVVLNWAWETPQLYPTRITHKLYYNYQYIIL